ncbi:MAG: tyrosine-type recombinase/integrase, partial [Limisphaerales bacterium]
TSPRNQINDRLAASNFLNWCTRRQFATANNMAPIDKPAVDTHEPRVLSVGDCRKLLAAAREYNGGTLLPYVAISLFAGLRPAEISRLNWDRIDLTDGTITLDGSMAKTRQRRIVKLPENAVAWLLPVAPQRPVLVPAAFARHFGRIQKAVGFGNHEFEVARQTKAHEKAVAKAKKAGRALPPTPAKVAPLRPWVQDYMRHTAISMYLATHKHEGEAASWAGNSPNVIHRHYKGLVKEADAKEFWGTTPANVKSEIAKLPVGTKSVHAAAAA